MKSHGRIFVRLAEKVAVIDFLSESFHCRDNKMISQISACVGRRVWLEFGLSAKQEKWTWWTIPKASTVEAEKAMSGLFPPYSPDSVLIHIVPLQYTSRLPAYILVLQKVVFEGWCGPSLPRGYSEPSLCSMDGCGIEFYGVEPNPL